MKKAGARGASRPRSTGSSKRSALSPNTFRLGLRCRTLHKIWQYNNSLYSALLISTMLSDTTTSTTRPASPSPSFSPSPFPPSLTQDLLHPHPPSIPIQHSQPIHGSQTFRPMHRSERGDVELDRQEGVRLGCKSEGEEDGVPARAPRVGQRQSGEGRQKRDDVQAGVAV